jgi:hypothetical protein
MQLFLIIYQHQSMQLFPNIVQYQLMQLFFNIKKFQHQHKQLFLIFYHYQPMQLFLNIYQCNFFLIPAQTIISHHLLASTYTITSQYLFNIKNSIGLEQAIIFQYYFSLFSNIKKIISSFFNINFNINIAIYYNILDLTTVYLTHYNKMTKHEFDYF